MIYTCAYIQDNDLAGIPHPGAHRQAPENATMCSGEQQLSLPLLLLSCAAVFSWLSWGTEMRGTQLSREVNPWPGEDCRINFKGRQFCFIFHYPETWLMSNCKKKLFPGLQKGKKKSDRPDWAVLTLSGWEMSFWFCFLTSTPKLLSGM